MSKKINLLRIIGVIAVLMYLIAYGLVFNVFEFYEPCSYDDWNYTIYRMSYVPVMVCFGVSFTIALISFLNAKVANKLSTCIINIICSILQMSIMIGAILIAKRVIKTAEFRECIMLDDHAKVIVVIACILMAINVVWMVVAIVCYLKKTSTKHSKAIEQQKVLKSRSYLHIILISVPVLSVIIGNLYLGALAVIAIVLHFTFFFVIPASILLVCVVRKWIESGKYLFSICGYAIYGYLVYGAVYRWTMGIAEEDIRIGCTDYIIFESILGLLNVAVVVSVIVVLIINYVREKKV
ncbi:MAG: hypothetical protein IJP13_03705 [Lachnospiraceae bacterium]|nr:hypothetical protein [Lachnospiraceae bacterium]